jgi:hypothetical protein
MEVTELKGTISKSGIFEYYDFKENLIMTGMLLFFIRRQVLKLTKCEVRIAKMQLLGMFLSPFKLTLRVGFHTLFLKG